MLALRRSFRRPAFSVACALLVTAGLGPCASPSHAAVLDFRITSTPATAPDGTPLILNDFILDFQDRYTGSQLDVQLDAGAVYQSPDAPGFAPPVNLTRFASLGLEVPDLSIDTYFAHGPDLQTQYPHPFLVGGPVNLDVDQKTAVNTPDHLALAWSAPPAAKLVDHSDLRIFRLALTADAAGSFQFLASAPGSSQHEDFFVTSQGDAPHFVIQDGHIIEAELPEPPAASSETDESGWNWINAVDSRHFHCPIDSDSTDPTRLSVPRDPVGLPSTLRSAYQTAIPADHTNPWAPNETLIRHSLYRLSRFNLSWPDGYGLGDRYAVLPTNRMTTTSWTRPSETLFLDGHAVRQNLFESNPSLELPEPAAAAFLALGALAMSRLRVDLNSRKPRHCR